MARAPSAWDRTNEFRHLVEDVRFRSASTTEVPPQNEDVRHSSHNEAADSEFTRIASSIGNGLSETNDKIRELEQLVQRRSIFDDRSAEIQALTYDIRQSIVQLSSSIEAFARQEPSTTTSHDAAHHRSVVQALRMRWGEATMKLKQLLEMRAETMKAQEDRRSLYSHSGIAARRPVASTTHDTESEHLLESGGDVQHSQPMFAPLRTQQRKPIYQTARAEAVESVQRMVGELAQIFNRVAALVSAQEELTVRIEDDMTSAMHNLEEGEAHLIKYFRSISSNRSLILKVFAVLLVFVVFFVVFLA